MALGLSKLLTSTAAALDRRFGWDKLPRPLGVLTLVGLRTRLREKNLYDTGSAAPRPRRAAAPHSTRTLDGSYNDLEQPAMGMIGARFGRNVPLEHTFPEREPRAARAEPAARQPRAADARRVHAGDDVNVLAGAWIQFEVHDWFSHGKNEPEEPVRARARRRRPLARAPDADRAHAQRSRRRTRTGGAADLRHGRHALVGRLADLRQRPGLRGRAARERGRQAPPRRPTACCRATSRQRVDLTGVAGNFWLGLGAAAHALHARAQRDLRPPARRVPGWSDDELYDRARLINAALMAKIHTVEWTPAIIAHPTTQVRDARQLVGPPRRAACGSGSSNEVLGGIPGSPTDHHGVPYSLTEEFVAVYRMHPLMPDDFTFRSVDDGRGARRSGRSASSARSTRARRLDEVGFATALYSFGDRPPGRDHAAQLPALPAGVPSGRTGRVVDLAAIDSCASASAACRATTSSGGSSTCGRPRRSRS